MTTSIRKPLASPRNLLIFIVVVAVLASAGLAVYLGGGFAERASERAALEAAQRERIALAQLFVEHCGTEATRDGGALVNSCALFALTRQDTVVFVTTVFVTEDDVRFAGLLNPREATPAEIPLTDLATLRDYRDYPLRLSGPTDSNFGEMARAWSNQMPAEAPPEEPQLAEPQTAPTDDAKQ